MLVTVAICTWNRSRLLRQALEQMTRAVPPPGTEHEVLVVNNNCTDDTDQVISSFTGRLPIRRIFERRPGQSNARNTAVREARGRYILWTDDDVLVGERWIIAYVEAFERWPDAVVFGGPISPWFAAKPPVWLESAWAPLAVAYATRDFGPEPLRLDGRELVPFGANFAVRLLEQRLAPYDPELGLRPGGSMRGEEQTVIAGILARGSQGWWVPGATVRHLIPAERMTTRYLRDYFMGLGEYGARVDDTIAGDTIPKFLGRPRWAWRRALTEEARYRFARVFRPPEVWVPHLIDACMAWGILRNPRRRGEGSSRRPWS
jgi:glycosyltransferase involved in cell wall biosynthesis